MVLPSSVFFSILVIWLEPALSLMVVWTAAGRSDILTVCSFSSSAEKAAGQASPAITAIDIAAIVFFICYIFTVVRRVDASGFVLARMAVSTRTQVRHSVYRQ